MRFVAVAALALALGFGGGLLLGTRFRSEPSAVAFNPMWAEAAAEGSYFLDRVVGCGPEIEGSHCTLLTPRSHETHPNADGFLNVIPNTPPGPYLAALGLWELDGGGEAANAIARHGQILKRNPQVRVLVSRQARPRLPGRCFTVQACFYSAPDPFFDEADFQTRLAKDPGVLLFVVKTYQLAEQPPRLIEARIEVHTEPGVGFRHSVCALLGEERAGKFALDPGAAHFDVFGSGTRRGLLWLDRSAGLGPPDLLALAYRIRVQEIATEPLPAGLFRTLLAITGRA